jgi:hypothetical protein
MKKTVAILIVIAVLIPIGRWWFSPEQVIMQRTKHLMEVLTLSDGTTGAMRQAKVYSMNAMLAPEVELSVPDIDDANGTFDKQEMESAFSWICQNAKQSEFRITGFREIVISGEDAKVRFFAEGFMDLGGSRPADGNFDVAIHWRKGGDGWRFGKVSWKSL